MKPTRSYLIICVSLALAACGGEPARDGELTPELAELLLAECLGEEPRFETESMTLGRVSFRPGDAVQARKLATYRQLAEAGVITLVKNEGSSNSRIEVYTAEVTPEGEAYETRSGRSSFDGSPYGTYRMYSLQLEGVASVTEVPAFGGAEARATYRKADPTPFSALDEDASEETVTQRVEYRKTSDRGWIACD